MSHIKLSWRNTILAATLPAVLEVLWLLYNTYVPLFLQAGNPAFSEVDVNTLGFGLGPALTGVILVLDNIAGLFLSPLVGAWSDSLRTRWGRRLPIILIGLPVGVIAFFAIPLIPMAIPPELSGQAGDLTGLLAAFIITLFVVLVALAIVRPIADVLMFDITPSEHRSTANGIAGAIAGLLVVITALGGAALYDVYGPLPFWLASGLAIIVLVLIKLWIKEPKELASAKELAGEPFNLKSILKFLRNLPKEYARSLIFLLLSNLLAYIALAQMQAFLSSYGVFALGMDVSAAAMLVAIPAIAFMIVAVPAGIIPNKIGRKRAQIIGLLGFALGSLVIYMFPTDTMLMVGLIICGLTWPLANIVQVAMVIDSAPVETLMGTYTGLRQVSVTLGFVIGPLLGGVIVELLDFNYRWVWLIMFIFLIFATVALLPVTKGEIKKISTLDA
jgi:maltose/moltooligosaccharide transporter